MWFISVQFRMIWSWNRGCHANEISCSFAYLVTADLIPRTTDAKFPDCGPNRRDAPRASAETLSGILSADTFDADTFDVSLHTDAFDSDAFDASLQGTTRLYTTIK